MHEAVLKPIRVALYSRVSSEEQREGQTIDSQVDEIDRFARAKCWVIAGIYKDEGWSGAILARPELDRLRDDARKGAFDAVLINDVDRLARDVSHLGIVKRDLERHSVQVIFKKLPAESSPTHNLMVNILGSFAEFERELILDRTRRGRKHKVEVRQEFLGGLCPYGYRYTPKDKAANKMGLLEVVREEALVVRQMFNWVDREGLSVQRVTERLTALKIIPKKRGDFWGKSSVLRMLHNQTYAGMWHYNKYESCEPRKPTRKVRYRNTAKGSTRLRPRSEWIPVQLPAHLKIVEMDQWQRVQDQLRRNKVFSVRNSKHQYLLTGLVRCTGCGSCFTGTPYHERFYYRCNDRCKKIRSVKEEHLDTAVWNAVEQAVLNPDVIADQVAQFEARQAAVAEARATEASERKKAVAEVEREESRIIEAYRKGIITAEQLGREMEEFRSRRAALGPRKLAGGHSIRRRPDETKRSIQDWCKTISSGLRRSDEGQRRRFLQLLVDEVLFDGDSVQIKCLLPASRSPIPNAIAGDFVASLDDPPIAPDTNMRGIGRREEYTFEINAPVEAAPQPLLQQLGADYVVGLVRSDPTATLEEYRELVWRDRGLTIGQQTMFRLLKQVGLSRPVRQQLSETGTHLL